MDAGLHADHRRGDRHHHHRCDCDVVLCTQQRVRRVRHALSVRPVNHQRGLPLDPVLQEGQGRGGRGQFLHHRHRSAVSSGQLHQDAVQFWWIQLWCSTCRTMGILSSVSSGTSIGPGPG